MVDQQTNTTDERPEEAGQEAEARATAGTASEGAGETERAGAPPEPPSDWPDLDAYRQQLREEHAAWSERLHTVQTQLASVRPVLAQIAAQYEALGVEQDIMWLCEAVLGGAGMVQRVRFDFDLERYLTLAWPAQADPRPALAEAHAEGEYRVDIWFGIGPDGRARVRVEGAKRLEAPLPTTRERLRKVLLGAVQSPRHIPAGTEAGAPEAAAPEPAAEPPNPNAPEPPDSPLEEGEGQPVESASPRPGDADEPPPEEQVIPLGPAHEEER